MTDITPEAARVHHADLRAARYMVRNVVTAHPWEPVAGARHKMLENSFTCLPMRHDDRWCLLTDRAVAEYLHGKGNGPEAEEPTLREKLKCTISEATQKHALGLEDAMAKPPETPVAKVVGKAEPVLVVRTESGEDLLGIVTASDLL